MHTIIPVREIDESISALVLCVLLVLEDVRFHLCSVLEIMNLE